MPFLSGSALEQVGFKSLGKDVRVSDKAAIYDPSRIEIGDYSRVDDFSVLSGSIKIGRNVHLAVYSNVAGGSEGVVFEDFAGLAYGCHVFTQSDDYSGGSLTNPTVPSKYKKEMKAAVRIGRHCIVGTGSVILPGVHLADGTSVGALSLVTKSTEEWWIYFGAPAKKIKRRKKDLLELEAEYLSSNKE